MRHPGLGDLRGGRTDVLVVPGEGIVKAISQVSHRRFGTVKVLFDLTLVAVSISLSFLFFHKLSGLGIGTLITAVIVGRFVNLLNSRLPLLSLDLQPKNSRKNPSAC
mgnify:CR=1 FL=1